MSSTSRRRLRLEDVRHSTTPDGHCRIEVTLEWYGRRQEGTADGLQTHHGILRASASAALSGALSAAGKRVDAELVGVKAVRAFDGWVVVVRLNAEAEGRHLALLGASSCEDEPELARAAVQAVLDAMNRVLEGRLDGSTTSPTVDG